MKSMFPPMNLDSKTILILLCNIILLNTLHTESRGTTDTQRPLSIRPTNNHLFQGKAVDGDQSNGDPVAHLGRTLVGLQFDMSFSRKLLRVSKPGRASELFVLRDDRLDPFNHFRKYIGGFNINNTHYWASTAFTGMYGYAVAAVWLLMGMLLGVLWYIFSCHAIQKDPGMQPLKRANCNIHNNGRLLFSIILTAIVVSGCAVLLVANQQFHSRSKDVERILRGASNNATQTVYKITSTLTYMESELKPYNPTAVRDLRATSVKLNKDVLIMKKTEQNDAIHKALRIIFVTISALVSFNLAFGILGLVLILLNARTLFCLLIVLGWILVGLDWLTFGFTLVIRNLVGDTCLTILQYEQNPYNSTLNTILPCVGSKSAKGRVLKARKEIYSIINQVNTNITALHREGQINGQNFLAMLPYVCDPFSGPPDYQYNGSCDSGSVPVGEIPQILEALRCSNTNTTKQCLNDTTVEMSLAYTTAAASLLGIIPSMESLTNCSFVVDAFYTIANRLCQPIKAAAKMEWITMLAISITMSTLIAVWASQILQSRQKRFWNGAIMPHNNVQSPNGA